MKNQAYPQFLHVNSQLKLHYVNVICIIMLLFLISFTLMIIIFVDLSVNDVVVRLHVLTLVHYSLATASCVCVCEYVKLTSAPDVYLRYERIFVLTNVTMSPRWSTGHY